MDANTPLILVVNDDGITAPGILALVEVAKKFGEVIVVAPDKPQSGMGHAITINSTLRVSELDINGVKGYSCSGTPVDCVKIAVNRILPRRPDIILSGINHGSNSSINVMYSGTMSAAIEGALQSIPSIGFSLLNNSIDADFTAAKKYAQIIISKVLQNKTDSRLCLNVNIPNIEEQLINGIKICRQADAIWEEHFEERKDPQGKIYYWLTGEFLIKDESVDNDEWALANNYVSVVPIQHDFTDYNQLETLKKWI